jgi:hypothetical protein
MDSGRADLQDLCVVPIMLVLPFLAEAEGVPGLLSLGKAALVSWA